ncbi:MULTISPECIES: ATP-binding protein [unclassified Actinoplanes]|uniref:sensor histidine kinase n=1 Tax=unclassified Actinoplanes TaxID=2626549 RepID=UPI00031BB026|nr:MULTISPECIES: ATP-binding protein [unclassified Actinoplanes]
MASRMLEAPMSLVTLVDQDRQWFASAVGLPEPWATERQTPLTYSFCRYVVATEAPLVVMDARADVGLCDSKAITELGMVAYAGYPLRAPGGAVLGAFCVADSRPRRWEYRELTLVGDLAAIAASEVAALLGAGELAVAHQDAEQQRAFLEALLDSLDTGVVACDPAGRLIRFNQALRYALDDDADPALSPRQWARRLRVLHPDGRRFTAEEMPLLRALAGEHVRDVEHLVVGRDDQRLVFRTNAQRIAGPDGSVLGAVAVSQDISAQYRTGRFRDAELAVHRAFIASTDPADAAAAVVQAVGTALDWAHAELWLADELSDMLHPIATWTDPQRPAVHVPASLGRGSGLAGTAWHEQQPVWVPDLAAGAAPMTADIVTGSRLRAALAVPVRGADQALGALTVFAPTAETKDSTCVTLVAGIAAQVGAFLQRCRADELRRELIQSKDEYIALVGHELRTPLTSISANTELLRDTDDTTAFGEVRDLVEVIDRNNSHLLALVGELLDLAGLDSGHTQLHIAPVDLAALVGERVSAARPGAQAAGADIRARIPPRLTVAGDEARLRQMVGKLIDNAVKYSVHGGPVDVVLVDNDGVAELDVTDTGIGIPDDERELVFHRFHRSSRARTHGIAGTGLGLALCRTIIERHHGTIAVSPPADRSGSGTRISVRIPVAAGSAR